ncbi:unnamed protein product [Chironomus riparius]|uniref:Peptidase S1 domain-containing protein n=1 Tax=Chironomus riparius TaxID=315576 RepID=A0A9N9S026_9DIPT|nr:unnamed protein product [Chironomus riparius]
MSNEKILNFFISFCLIFNKFYCQISECEMSADLGEARKSRLHHPCEINRNPYFHIETHENFYCVFYSSIDTSIFGEATVNIKVDGEWEVEQIGSKEFSSNQTSILFTVLLEDVILKIFSEDEDEIPKIVSVIVTLGDETEEYCSTTKCGMRSEAIPVIINGEKVREGSWPWHAAIYYRPTTGTIKFRCGATIINERTLITIATCLVTYNAAIQKRVELDIDKLSVAVGETILFDSSGTRQVFKVNEIKFHENYTKEYVQGSFNSARSYKDDYNVALIILHEDIRYSLHVVPICLPTSDEYDYDGKVGKVVGWGFSEVGDLKISQHLQDLTVPTNNFLTCMFRAFNRTIYSGFSASRNFCAGYKRHRGICTGDSGGGLYIKEDSQYTLYGLASFANCECVKEENRCTIYGEGFFVNLVKVLKWIQNNMY